MREATDTGLHPEVTLMRVGYIGAAIASGTGTQALTTVSFAQTSARYLRVTQLPSALGVPGGGDHFVERVATLGHQVGGTNPVVLAVATGALALLLLGDHLLPGRPVALVVVVLSIVATTVLGLHDRGVATVGAIPAGLPTIGLPGIRARDVDGVEALAAACLLLAYVESVSAARALASKHGYDVDVRRELLALGGANLLAALGHGYPVAGGLSQSAVNEKAGAKSRLALVVASIALGVALLFLTGLLRNLPKAVLAAIVLVAVKGLIDVREIGRLRRVSRLEFRVAITASFLLTFLVMMSFALTLPEFAKSTQSEFMTQIQHNFFSVVVAVVGFYFGSEAVVSIAKAVSVTKAPESAAEITRSDRDLAETSTAQSMDTAGM